MTALTYDNLAEKLVEAVPELRAAYDAERAWWGDERPDPYNIYEPVLNPYLTSLLEADGGEEPLHRIFAFLEKLARHEEDAAVPNLVAVVVIEPLLGTELLIKARRYMDAGMAHLVEDMEERWAKLAATLPPPEDPVWQRLKDAPRPTAAQTGRDDGLAMLSVDLPQER